MHIVNIFEAKSSLSRLIERIESGTEAEIVIARHGRPVAKLVRVNAQAPERRIGIAKGRFEVPDSIDTYNEEVARLFLGDEGS